jgi:hypothetical protein
MRDLRRIVMPVSSSPTSPTLRFVRRGLAPMALLVVAAASSGSANAQTLGDLGAASAASSSMSGAGQGGTLAVGSRAMNDARRLGGNPYAGGSNPANRQMVEEAMGSSGAGYPSGYPGGGAGGGYPGAGSAGYPGAGSGEGGPDGAGGPAFPDPNNPGGPGVAAGPRQEPLRWGKETGNDFLNELLSRRTAGRGTGRAVAPSRRVSPKQMARLPRQTRSRIIASKYKKPPVGYLSYYLPQDRYKVTSAIWKYVSIEDDRARYPVKHYYRPDSPVFLRILSQKPRNGQARYNRVIGFASWQDALSAGYRPDPVSKPAPGAELATLASIAPRANLARYTEFLYSGQIPPQAFGRTFSYIRRVQRVINSRQDTRRYLRPTVGQILLAALGEGSIPRTVGGTPRAVVTTNVMGGPGGYPGGSSGYPGGSGSGYPGGSSGYPGGSSGYPGSSGGYPGGSDANSNYSSSASYSPTGGSGYGGGTETVGIRTGPRGGRYHLSASGNRVYERRGSSRSSARRRR